MEQNQASKNRFVLLIVSLILEAILIMITFFSKSESLYVWSIVGIWLIGTIYCLYSIYDRIFFLMFLLAFFNFLIGRSVLIALGIYEPFYKYTLEQSISGQQLVLGSLLMIILSFIYFDKKVPIKMQALKQVDIEVLKIKLISKWVFYFTYIFLITTVVATILYVRRYGYTSIYIDTSAKVPILIKKLGDIAPFAFFIFLGSLPKKREVIFPIGLYTVYLILSLGTGGRFDFVIGLLALFAYFVLRNKLTPHEVWFQKKNLKYYIMFGLSMMVVLSAYNSLRFNRDLSGRTPVQLLTKFTYDQGVSVNIPKRIFKYSAKIPTDRLYSMDSIISFYQRNIGTRLLGQEYYEASSVEKALNGNSLGDVLSYILYGRAYLEGNGGGSSYVAEVFLDFGWIGIILVSILYSRMLIALRNRVSSNPYMFMIIFMVFMAFLKAPRARTDVMILKLIDPMLWISIAIVYIAVRTVVKVRVRKSPQLQMKVVEHG